MYIQGKKKLQNSSKIRRTSLGFLSKKWDCMYFVIPSPILLSETPKNQTSISSICSLCTTTESEFSSSKPQSQAPPKDRSSITWYPWEIGTIQDGFWVVRDRLFLLLESPTSSCLSLNACHIHQTSFRSTIHGILTTFLCPISLQLPNSKRRPEFITGDSMGAI